MPTSYWAREDSGSANNPALNLTGADAVEITFVSETPSGGAGDLLLDQPSGGGTDPDTVVSINGTNYSFTFEFTGTFPTQKKDGAQQVPDQYEGLVVYVITVEDYPTAGETTRMAFMPNETATQTEMDDFGNGAIDVQALNTSPPPSSICFAARTRILTPRGEIAVEALAPGDLVVTDAGLKPVRWIGCTRFEWPRDAETARPIRIRAGALKAGCPARDLVVSPQHKIVLAGGAVSAMTGCGEVMVPAKALLGHPGVREMRGCRSIDYFHLLLDRHAVVFADGAPAESFYPGPTAMQMLTQAQRFAVLRCVPALIADPVGGYGPPARRTLTVRQGRELVAATAAWRRQSRATPLPVNANLSLAA